MAMPYPPPLPLPVPTSMPPVPDALLGIDLASIGLMNPEEELSNQQLNFTVILLARTCMNYASNAAGRFCVARTVPRTTVCAVRV